MHPSTLTYQITYFPIKFEVSSPGFTCHLHLYWLALSLNHLDLVSSLSSVAMFHLSPSFIISIQFIDKAWQVVVQPQAKTRLSLIIYYLWKTIVAAIGVDKKCYLVLCLNMKKCYPQSFTYHPHSHWYGSLMKPNICGNTRPLQTCFLLTNILHSNSLVRNCSSQQNYTNFWTSWFFSYLQQTLGIWQ